MYPKKPTFRPAPWQIIGLAFVVTMIMAAIKYFSTDPAGIKFIESIL